MIDTRRSLRIDPAACGHFDGADEPSTVLVADYPDLFHGARLLGGCRIGSVVYWYHPPTDQLIRADLWGDIVGDPDAPPEPASESFVD